MLVQQTPPLHLTYCLNVHTGESWPDVLEGIKTISLAVRDRVAPNQSFGLGLRLSFQAAVALSDQDTLSEFKAVLAEQNLYVPTINGFPYGAFHGERVKENVYAPDWRSEQRRDYTNRLADILAELLPDGMTGSISTVPIGYRTWIKTPNDRAAMIRMLSETAEHLEQIQEENGSEIHLGLEPEPDCYLESADDVIQFLEKELFPVAEDRLRRHVGVCLDTCHASVRFQNPQKTLQRYIDAGIRISKIQLSAGLEADATETDALGAFADKVYLHQVSASRDGHIDQWDDLPAALEAIKTPTAYQTVRVHCHVPLSWEGDDLLRSTRVELTDDFFSLLRQATEHAEIETYTFHVLPMSVRGDSLVDSIVSEYAWVRDQL